MTRNRKDIRAQLKAILDAGASIPQDIIGYKPSLEDIQAQSPIVSITSAGGSREAFTFQGMRLSPGLFDITLYVLTTDGAGFTKDEAEDLLDDLEAEIAGTLANNRSHSGYWQDITWASPSSIADVAREGVTYIREIITLAIECVA